MTQYNQNFVSQDYEDAIPDTPPPEYKPLPEGTYHFKVTDMTRSVWPDSAKKLHGAKRVELTLRFWNDNGDEGEGDGILTLHPQTNYKVRQFFRSIGCNVVSGQPFVPEWNKVRGAEGLCKVKTRTWKRDDKEYFANSCDEWLEPSAKAQPVINSPAEMDPF